LCSFSFSDFLSLSGIPLNAEIILLIIFMSYIFKISA